MAARKKEDIVVSKSKEAIVKEMATQTWDKLFNPDEDAEKNAANFKTASDMLQKLFDEARILRDGSKPKLRERKETEDVMATAAGKTLAELQGAYVQIRVGGTDEKPLMDRVSMSKLRVYSQVVDHPYHEAATAFLADHKVRFVEREGKSGGRGITVLEPVAAEKVKKAA